MSVPRRRVLPARLGARSVLCSGFYPCLMCAALQQWGYLGNGWVAVDASLSIHVLVKAIGSASQHSSRVCGDPSDSLQWGSAGLVGSSVGPTTVLQQEISPCSQLLSGLLSKMHNAHLQWLTKVYLSIAFGPFVPALAC